MDAQHSMAACNGEHSVPVDIIKFCIARSCFMRLCLYVSYDIATQIMGRRLSNLSGIALHIVRNRQGLNFGRPCSFCVLYVFYRGKAAECTCGGNP